MLVYRPNSQTELMESKYNENEKERNNNKDDNQDNDNKSEASRSYSRKSPFWSNIKMIKMCIYKSNTKDNVKYYVKLKKKIIDN